jgi:hypothetical protein
MMSHRALRVIAALDPPDAAGLRASPARQGWSRWDRRSPASSPSREKASAPRRGSAPPMPRRASSRRAPTSRRRLPASSKRSAAAWAGPTERSGRWMRRRESSAASRHGIRTRPRCRASTRSAAG